MSKTSRYQSFILRFCCEKWVLNRTELFLFNTLLVTLPTGSSQRRKAFVFSNHASLSAVFQKFVCRHSISKVDVLFSMMFTEISSIELKRETANLKMFNKCGRVKTFLFQSRICDTPSIGDECWVQRRNLFLVHVCIILWYITDDEPPTISVCPKSIVDSTSNGTTTMNITWAAPTASDNSGFVTLTSSHDPGTLFSVGTTEVNYTAVDLAGNMAEVCAFNVTINGMHLTFYCFFLLPRSHFSTKLTITPEQYLDFRHIVLG